MAQPQQRNSSFVESLRQGQKITNKTVIPEFLNTMIPHRAARNKRTDEPAIGIDLGTTNSCVGMVRDGRVKIIHNHQGNRTTPSCVAFTDEERLIGNPAKEQLIRNPENTVYEVKRLIGRHFEEVKSLMEKMPFKVKKIKTGEMSTSDATKKFETGEISTSDATKKIETGEMSTSDATKKIETGEMSTSDATKNANIEESIMIEVQHRQETKQYRPETISSMILEYMKAIAMQKTRDKKITKAVVTVPAYFNQSQRRATIDAATIAGFEDCEILSEPTAAAFAYRMDGENHKKNILVYDLGGGTFDVSIVQIAQGSITVKATDGDTCLGGLDFDNELVDYALENFKQEPKKVQSTDDVAMARLKVACENAKRTLSDSKRAHIQIDHEGETYTTSISRAVFEDKCHKLFDRTLEIVKKCLEDANMEKEDIQDVLLVGGSTRIPRVQEILKEFFSEKKLNKAINPDEAVAHGAALYAAMKFSNVAQKTDFVALNDVIPLSLGTQEKRGLMSILIERNMRIPLESVKCYNTALENQTEIVIDVLEGERTLAEKNHKLSELKIEVPKRPVGESKVLVSYKVDSNGILEVTAQDYETGRNKKSLTISEKTGRLSRKEIDKMIKESETFKAQDEVQKARIEAMNHLESYALRTRSRIRYQEVTSEADEKIKEECEKVLDWLAKNQRAGKKEFVEKLSELKLKTGNEFS